VTEPERPADTPSSPTPEEISARLEALLKRTHALRAKQAADPPSPLTITWPPHDGDLDHYDVVDVPEDDRMQSAPAPTTTSVPAVATPQETTREPERPESFARPDWSELRLRSAQDDPPRTPRRLLLLTLLLALATLAQAVYIWSSPRAAGPGEARLRVDGPDGAMVRVNGQPIGPAPIDHVLAPGDYDIEVARDGGTARASRVSIGVGRTVMILSPAQATPTETAPLAAVPPAVTPAPAQPARPAVTAPASPNPAATAPAAVSATLGGVSIESTPSGLPVTMEGRTRGVTPITIGQLKPGRHDVLVGGLPRKVDVAAGSLTTLRVTRP
jgi:hypothetical protein